MNRVLLFPSSKGPSEVVEEEGRASKEVKDPNLDITIKNKRGRRQGLNLKK